MRRYLGLALLISKSAAFDNIPNTETVEGVDKEVKLLRGSAVAWPDFQNSVSEQDSSPPHLTTSGIADDKLGSEAAASTPQPEYKYQAAEVQDGVPANTASVYDGTVGHEFVWNGKDSKLVSGSTSVLDEYVRWSRDDCNPCEVPTQPPTLAPIYPHREDDYQDHLPDVNEQVKTWEAVEDNLSQDTETPSQTSTGAPTGAPVSASNENYVDHLPHVTDVFKYWEGVTDILPPRSDATQIKQQDTRSEAPSIPGISGHQDENADHLPHVAEDFKDWDGLKESLPTYTDAPDTPTRTQHDPVPPQENDHGKYENCTKVIDSFGERYECPEDATLAPSVKSSPHQEDTARPSSETSTAPETVAPAGGDSTAPETTSPDTVATDTAPPASTTAPDTTDSTAPDTVAPAGGDSTKPETTSPETVAPADTSVPDTIVPAGRESTAPETNSPDTVASDTLSPADTSVPDTVTPGDTDNGAGTATPAKNAGNTVGSAISEGNAGTTTSGGTTTSKGTTGNATGSIDSAVGTDGTTSEDTASVTASTGNNPPSSSSPDALGAGAIAGIVIGCVAFVAAVVGSVLFRQKMLARQREESLFADLSDTGGGFEADYAAM
ncbi:hypothetical protein PF005_g11697 [Phytophthora fragariae]|uniref:Uncharacterized protein n=1 Tax=Phytophthora fragariae TaxID=53985 RepID=A0A6A3Y1E2_9STRA|nr:hypothetical protein PF003_g9599 [Phytophthora fragariae]KAE8937177.1 hypothetical protein PF009_g12916 [Phytophthora fragariae]KAE9009075.1 hypothetical protein PF011_g10434 [Phytophthora fragariae]KAE9110429.1 hypothetical protein PF007_g11859 [Phytophthora fragariae]KAE9110539.1 hypothetical protein PF010_g11127 [Phytophthora fragariae]